MTNFQWSSQFLWRSVNVIWMNKIKIWLQFDIVFTHVVAPFLVKGNSFHLFNKVPWIHCCRTTIILTAIVVFITRPYNTVYLELNHLQPHHRYIVSAFFLYLPFHYLYRLDLSIDYILHSELHFIKMGWLFIKYVTLQRKKGCVRIATCPWVRVKIMSCDVTLQCFHHSSVFHILSIIYNIHSNENSSCKCHSRSLMNRRLIGANFEWSLFSLGLPFWNIESESYLNAVYLIFASCIRKYLEKSPRFLQFVCDMGRG